MIREQVAWALALSNAGVDFPEEDVVFSHQNEIKEKIYQSYFIEGLDIGDKEILINIGKEFDINEDKINEFLNLENIERVNSYRQIANEKNIMGVPFFEIRNDYISGAQSSSNLASVIKNNFN